jgi:hypothetical protein
MRLVLEGFLEAARPIREPYLMPVEDELPIRTFLGASLGSAATGSTKRAPAARPFSTTFGFADLNADFGARRVYVCGDEIHLMPIVQATDDAHSQHRKGVDAPATAQRSVGGPQRVEEITCASLWPTSLAKSKPTRHAHDTC